MKRPTKLRQALEFYGFSVGAALIRSLPLSTAQRLAAALARAVFNRGGKRVGYTLVNLRIAFPELAEQERRQIGRESYVHFAWNMIDLVRSEKWSDDEIRRHVRMVGVENFNAAMEKGKGALLLTLHLGHFELGSLAAPLWGVRAVFVGRPLTNQRLYERVSAQRTRTGGGLIGKRGVALRIARELRKGNAVGLLNDQYSKRARGVFVPFFGVRCSTTAGAAMISLRTGAPVLPGFVVRDAADHHTATILPALETQTTGDLERDILSATADYNRAYEEIIRRHPEQYWWHTRRYRHSPDLPEDPYD
jgi:KDO2-lipid IV(A) lauroyltransferase